MNAPCLLALLLLLPHRAAAAAAPACSPPVHEDPRDHDAAPADPALGPQDCARFAQVEALGARLAQAAGLRLAPMAVKLKERVSGTYDVRGNRLVVTLGALRDPGAPGSLAGVLAHELGHALQFAENRRSGFLQDKTWRQIEAQADALGMILLERAGLSGAAMRQSQEAAWGCARIETDAGDENAPPFGYRWMNAVLLEPKVSALAATGLDPLGLVRLDDFTREGKLRGAFLSAEPAVASRLQSDALREQSLIRGCGVKGWALPPQ